MAETEKHKLTASCCRQELRDSLWTCAFIAHNNGKQ